MKKIIYMAIGFVICLVIISGVFMHYSYRTDPADRDIKTIGHIANMFKDELVDLGIDEETIDNAIAKIEELNEQTKHVVAFDIQNDTNPILNVSLYLPVNEEFFNSVEIGEMLAEEKIKKIEDFLKLDKDVGSWTVIVKDKVIRK